LTDARHVELQVFGDYHGNQLHLGERDCSVQRRHQKVIEEAPCPVMHEGLRRAMGDAAVAAAASIGYVGAGTVEFLLDEADDFYFLEMNTRLQVEHPVTELVTGLDLVALQLTVAQGGELPLAQGDIKLRGHAIEARLYAEDSYNDFLPAAGTAEVWEPPTGEGIRVDHGLASGQVISPFYDPMIAKIIAFGEDRPTALRRLRRALDETVIFGLASNREFLRELLARPAFAAGQATTTFIAGEFPGGPRPPLPTPAQLACAALLQHLEAQAASEAARVSADASLGGWSGLRSLPQRRRYDYAGAALDVLLWPEGDDSFRVRVGDEELELALCEAAAPGVLRLAIDGVESSVPFAFTAPGEVSLQWQGAAVALKDRLSASVLREGARGSGALLAPMHGTLLRLLVAGGDWVQVGDEVAVVEAMKMEHRIMADIDGTVSAVHAGVGEQVAAGALLVELVADEVSRP
jgi:geranyl-CoA carboxylase alpha subunit